MIAVPMLLVAMAEAPLFAQGFQKPTATGATPVTEAQFMKVMQTSCVRCHPVCKSINTIVARNWIVAGKPENSPVYTCLGKTKKPNAHYHDVTPAAKTIIHDFVAQYK